ncbi:MAG TPA: HlyD family efflux transporter periplasmic adaptor subunit [Candidatus Paceibacterota bacterium]
MPTETKAKKSTSPKVFALAAFIVVVLGGGIGAFAYFAASSTTVYIDKAQIEAPIVALSPTSSGTLNTVYVAVGQILPRGTVVANVGTELIKSTSGGLVITVNNNIGKTVGTTDVIVSTIDPTQLRVVGQVQEDKGLVDIAPGQQAMFTVDAFGSQKFYGIVDEVSPTSVASDVVFSVSDQREEQNFNVKIKFDTTLYPQLNNGMSAKIWVYKQ